jgi:hypothetical protein
MRIRFTILSSPNICGYDAKIFFKRLCDMRLEEVEFLPSPAPPINAHTNRNL